MDIQYGHVVKQPYQVLVTVVVVVSHVMIWGYPLIQQYGRLLACCTRLSGIQHFIIPEYLCCATCGKILKSVNFV